MNIFLLSCAYRYPYPYLYLHIISNQYSFSYFSQRNVTIYLRWVWSHGEKGGGFDDLQLDEARARSMTFVCFNTGMERLLERHYRDPKVQKEAKKNGQELPSKPGQSEVLRVASAMFAGGRGYAPPDLEKGMSDDDIKAFHSEEKVVRGAKNVMSFDEFARIEALRVATLKEYIPADGIPDILNDDETSSGSGLRGRDVAAGFVSRGKFSRGRHKRKTAFGTHYVQMFVWATCALSVVGGILGACVTVPTEVWLREQVVESGTATSAEVYGADTAAAAASGG